MSHICVCELGQYWFRLWLTACWAPSHYLNQFWLIINWDIRNKNPVKFESKYKIFHSYKFIWKCRLQNGGHFVRWKSIKSWIFCQYYWVPLSHGPTKPPIVLGNLSSLVTLSMVWHDLPVNTFRPYEKPMRICSLGYVVRYLANS